MEGDPYVFGDRDEFAAWMEEAKESGAPLPTCSGLPGPLVEAMDRVTGLYSVGQPIDQAVADAWSVFAEWYPSA